MSKVEVGQSTDSNYTTGVLYAVAAFLLWSILPLYWKKLGSAGALEILMHRILWSFVFSSTIVLFRGQLREARAVFRDRKKRGAIILGAIFIGLNWGIYIWAVNSNHVVDTSLGYYINPLLSVLLGIIAFKEKLTFWQLVSFALALIGVLVITFSYGRFPWISLSLALCFALYGLIKKGSNVDSALGLMLETGVLLPVALVYLGYLELQGAASFGHVSPLMTSLMLGAGVLTAAPLLWFSEATKRIPLSTVGFTQYLTPTGMLIIGVVLYNEPFTRWHLLGFFCIWVALAIFTLSQFSWIHRFVPRWFRAETAS